MITNFELITEELTTDELKILPIIIQGFKCHKKDNPIKAPAIIISLNEYLQKQGFLIKITEVRLRKFVNYIRANGKLPLIATPKGYYISDDKNELRMQVKSLQERAKSILNAADGLEIFIFSNEKAD